jgi:prepilin-type N-terminal cleavage/methylation domain-containing protein/prepilin-type processing-associated H-X9-DG protein
MDERTALRRAFTLIELLVVIAIIAILASILFPVFAKVREKGLQTACASNEKQIGYAFLAYSQDFDETFPPSNWIDPQNGGNSTWQLAVDPYIAGGFPAGQSGLTTSQKYLSVYYCPDWQNSHTAVNLTSVGGFAQTFTLASASPSKSYAANVNYLPFYGAGLTVNGAVYHASGPPYTGGPWPKNAATDPYASRSASNLSVINTPSQTVLIAETRGEVVQTSGNDTPNRSYEGAGAANGDLLEHDWGSYLAARTRHNGGSNYLFFDGHVKWFREPGFQLDGVTPIVATTGVVFSQAQNPNASGWFLEDPNAP